MKPAEIRALNDQQISALIDELREEWRHLRFEHAVGRLSKTARIGEIKRDIARLKTIQTERVMSEQIAAALAAEQASVNERGAR
ncbi:MAG: 50S ribosomal protein L29 [Chloroflexi bacterium]|nr:MAG: 50S ribosomal protein L29 [Chloroflexota bacterium]